MRFLRLAILPCLACLLAAAVKAQSVHWEASDAGTGNAMLVFEDCAPDDSPDLPKIPGVTFNPAGQSTNTNIVNFDVHRSVIINYQIRSRQNTPVQIPAFTVKTDKGVMKVAAYNAGAPTATAAENIASSKLIPEHTTVWAGEVFGLGYELTAARRNNPQISQNFDWNAAPLVAEDWAKPEVTEPVIDGERRIRVLFRTRAIAGTPNTTKLEAVSHNLTIQTGTVGFGFFQQAQMQPITVTSDQPTLTVRPLPPAPPGFKGAVGQFKLDSKIVPQKAAVGEPITWTMELSGSGNWPAIANLPQRDVSTDFQVVQPKARHTPAEGKLFDATLSEDVVLIPTKPGTYTLGPVNLVCFDPKTGSYQTLSAPKTTVTVTAPDVPKPAAGPNSPANSSPVDHTQSGSPASGPAKPVSTPQLPAGIPRDPLPGSDAAPAPVETGPLLALIAAPFAVVLALWAWLAVRRARTTDPLAPRRAARVRLAATLRQLRAGPNSPLLLAWQRDTAVLWQLSHAAPSASALSDPTWSQLWSECDRALYGAQSTLPPDWVARAEAALDAKRLPGFNALRLFLPRNLLPFAGLIALVFVSSTLLRGADGAIGAYQSGDFVAAEKSWRDAVSKNPTDWIARHNLSLALAQQDRPGEAAAHAAAAFVQNPGDPSVRWHLALATEKAGFAPAALAPFLTTGPIQSVARLASAPMWQRALIGAAIVVALALCVLLLNSYGSRSAATNWGAAVTIALGLLFSATALGAVHAYGLAARTPAVVVWRTTTLRSIPTEADTTQKTTSVGAGSIALADKTFLTWTRLAFDNGQTGWVRTEELVALWR